MTNVATTAMIALIAAAGPAAAQASLYDAETLNYRAAEVYDSGDSVLADTISTVNPKWAPALYAQAPKLGHAYAARQLTHHLANPPGETEVITKGGFGEDQ